MKYVFSSAAIASLLKILNSFALFKGLFYLAFRILESARRLYILCERNRKYVWWYGVQEAAIKQQTENYVRIVAHIA